MSHKALNDSRLEELRDIVSGILDVDPSTLTTDSGPESIGSWDSLANLSIVTAVEEKFSVRFSMDEIRRIDTFGALTEALAVRLAT